MRYFTAETYCPKATTGSGVLERIRVFQWGNKFAPRRLLIATDAVGWRSPPSLVACIFAVVQKKQDSVEIAEPAKNVTYYIKG
jgi:hypothetical protein